MKKSPTKVVPLRISETLDDLATLCAEREHTDKATALRQWLHKGAELYVVRLVSEGFISASRGAELLDLSIFDIFAIAENHRMELGPTDEQRLEARKNAEKLLLTRKA